MPSKYIRNQSQSIALTLRWINTWTISWFWISLVKCHSVWLSATIWLARDHNGQFDLSRIPTDVLPSSSRSYFPKISLKSSMFIKTVTVSRLAQKPLSSSLVSLVFWLLLAYAWKPSSMVKSLIHEPSRLNSNVSICLANDPANEKITNVPWKIKSKKIEKISTLLKTGFF